MVCDVGIIVKLYLSKRILVFEFNRDIIDKCSLDIFFFSELKLDTMTCKITYCTVDNSVVYWSIYHVMVEE